MPNPFRNLTKEEEARKKKQKEEIETRLKVVAESAKHILSSQDAVKYRKELEGATKDIIKTMIHNTETDPVKFFCFAKACLMKLDVYYTLLEGVEADAR